MKIFNDTCTRGDEPGAFQLPPPRSIEQLKSEVLARAGRNAYPLIGLDFADVREALSTIDSLDRDEWARAWVLIGDRYMAKAEAQIVLDRREADHNFFKAWKTYGLGRWPVPNSPGKQQAYEKSLAAFARHAELMDLPLEVVRIPFEAGEIVGYLQLPRHIRPSPIVLAIGGLDSRKEDLAGRFARLLPEGIGYIALDAPGTGQAPVKAGGAAERIYSRVLDYLAGRADVDSRRIAVFGGSFGGYWATKLAIVERQRLIGVVAQSPGVHTTYQPAHLRNTIANTEYLFDLIPAMMTTFDGVSDLDQLAEARAELSLVTQDLLSQPTAPILVIAGARDTQTPIEDIELLLRSGATPKEAWINPVGGHMGREASGWTDIAIFKDVTVPWLTRILSGPVH